MQCAALEEVRQPRPSGEAGRCAGCEGLDRPMKYRNKPCVIGAEKYRSQREAKRHQDLLLLQKAGLIAGLVREVPFELAPGILIEGETRKRPAVRYVADFVYSDVKAGKIVVEDAKGMQTPVYRLKKHLLATLRGIHVKEV
jgi:hypothetical protein